MFKIIPYLIAGFILLNTASGQWVYKTPYGEKYHTENCHTVKNVSEKLSLTEALKKGLEPCKICKPPAGAGPVYGSGNKQPSGQGQTVQCMGMTKAGTRCKHKTSIGNGYCFQHQPK